MSNLVYGIGINERKYPAWDGKKMLRVYRVWTSMLSRCTCEYWLKYPSYSGTTCSEKFKSYTFFYEWCGEQIGFNSKDENNRSWQLDKDILVRGNKVYSEDTCCFVPQYINSILTKADAKRGDCPVGVYWNKRDCKFMASCKTGTKTQKYLGYFGTKEDAFHAYKTFKEGLIKHTAIGYKDKIDKRVYQSLMAREVNEDD